MQCRLFTITVIRTSNCFEVEGLNRAITVQRLIHNWVQPHFSLGKNITPAVAIGYVKQPITIEKMLNCRSWEDNTF